MSRILRFHHPVFIVALDSLFRHVGYNASDRHNRLHYQQLVSHQTGNQVSGRNHHNRFPVSTDGTHIGVVYYNENATRTLGLQSGAYLPSITHVIDLLPYQDSSYHNMDIGLESARDELNANSRISTGDNFRVVIVFVNEPNSDNSADITESLFLKSQQMIIITVALSSLVSTQDLVKIASSPSDVFSAPSAASLAALWQNLSTVNLKPNALPVCYSNNSYHATDRHSPPDHTSNSAWNLYHSFPTYHIYATR